MALTNLAQAILNAINLAFIGGLGPDALAAAAMAASLYHAVMIFCMGLVSATMPILATTLGRGGRHVREARRTVRQGLWSAVIICLPAWLLLWHTEAVLNLLGQRPDLAAVAGRYMQVLQWALLPYLAYLVLRAFVATMQQPSWTLLAAGLAILVNTLAAGLLIHGGLGLPAMGLAGAGIATGGASLVMFLAMAGVLLRHRHFRRFQLFGRFWRPDWARLRELWSLGLPMAVTFALETSIFYAAVVMMGLIGTAALAAHAIAMQIASLAFMVPLAMGQVATIRVGRARGAGDADGVARAGWSAFAVGVGFMTTTALVMLLAPRLLIGAFLDLDRAENAPVIELAVVLLAYAALFQVVDGAQAVCAGMLRGLHDTRVPMLLAAIGYWGIGLPLGALLAFHWRFGAAGVWIGMATGLAAVAILLTGRWLRRGRFLPAA